MTNPLLISAKHFTVPYSSRISGKTLERPSQGCVGSTCPLKKNQQFPLFPKIKILILYVPCFQKFPLFPCSLQFRFLFPCSLEINDLVPLFLITPGWASLEKGIWNNRNPVFTGLYRTLILRNYRNPIILSSLQ